MRRDGEHGEAMFKEKLTRVIHNVDGAIGCLLIGFDGIQIDGVYAGEEMAEMSAIAIEVSNLLNKFRRLNLHEVGEVNEVSITTGTVTTLARVVSEEYLLVLAMSADADVNRGQTMLRLITPFVERDM
ncbi:MAG: hypothetical protein AAGI01_05155 [Myxococcota bacterium]